MRTVSMVLMAFAAGCGPSTPAYTDGVSEGSACATVRGEEQCVQDVTATRTEVDGAVQVRVEADVTWEGFPLGFETARLMVDARIDPDAVPGAPVDIMVEAPVGITCIHDIVHGEHCHYKVEADMACEVSVDESSARWTAEVTRLDDQGVALNVRGLAAIDRPDCCQQICTKRDEPAEAIPAGPYMVAVAIDVPFGAPEAEDDTPGVTAD